MLHIFAVFSFSPSKSRCNQDVKVYFAIIHCHEKDFQKTFSLNDINYLDI